MQGGLKNEEGEDIVEIREDWNEKQPIVEFLKCPEEEAEADEGDDGEAFEQLMVSMERLEYDYDYDDSNNRHPPLHSGGLKPGFLLDKQKEKQPIKVDEKVHVFTGEVVERTVELEPAGPNSRGARADKQPSKFRQQRK